MPLDLAQLFGAGSDDSQPPAPPPLDPSKLSEMLAPAGGNAIRNASYSPAEVAQQSAEKIAPDRPIQAMLTNTLSMMAQNFQPITPPKSGFRQGVADAAASYAGIKTPFEKQLATQNHNMDTVKTLAGVNQADFNQTQQSQMVTVMGPQGPMQVPFALAKMMAGPSMTGQYKIAGNEQNNASKERIAAGRIRMVDGNPYRFGDGGTLEPVGVTGRETVTFTPQEANAAGHPELANQELPLAQWAKLQGAAVKAGGNVTTGEGVFRQDKITGKLGEKLGSAPGVASAQARAYWQAVYGVVPTVDENGNPQYISRLNAPGAATATGAVEMFKGKAGLDNYKEALTRVKASLPTLEDNTQRALVAQTLRQIGTNHDPGIVSAFIGNAVSGGLTEQSADLVAATLQAREFIGANRQYAGNFRGSEQLYQRMVANIPGPLNSTSVNTKLVDQDLANTGRIFGSIKAFQAGVKNKPPASNGSLMYARDAQGKLHSAPAGTKLPSGWVQEKR